MFLPQWLSSSQKKCRSRAIMGNGLVCTQVCASKMNGDSYSLNFVCNRRSAVWAAVAMWQKVLELKKKKRRPPCSPFEKETICFQSRTRIRNSSLYAGQWSSLVFLCRGIPKPRRWLIQTTSPANCTREMIGRQKAQSDGAALPKISEGKSSRTSISIHESEIFEKELK